MLADRERGFLIFGIENLTKKKVGTSVRLKNKKINGGENFENWLNRLIEPKLNLELIDFIHDDMHFSIICIEASYDRPVKFKGAEYIRVGENTKKLLDFPDRERALWLATGRRKFEHATALANQLPEEIIQLLDVESYYALSSEPMPKNNPEIMRKFVSAGFINDNLQNSYDITNLGAILLAKNITKFPSISGKSVRIVRYVGQNKLHSDLEQEGKKGYAVGFSGLIKFIMERIQKEELYQDGVRRMQYIYPEIAIREIVANALIHQDFTISGVGPMIEIYSNRIEIINPGNSLIEIDRMLDERRSRNEKLAEAMRFLGICEERGGGLDKAMLVVEMLKLPAPEISSSKNSMKVTIFGMKSFGEMSKYEKQRACFIHCILRYLQKDYMSNSTLRARFSLEDGEYQAVSAVISDTIKSGKILPADPNQGKRTAKYVPYWAA
jgi:predicted HTH transcriptional regulator